MEIKMYEEFMKLAIIEAEKALLLKEVPVGAVIVKNGVVIAKGHNLRETLRNATSHAEVIAINEACTKLNGWRLFGCDMYVTLEPCPMCAGALVNARVDKIIYGAADHKRGACGSIYNIGHDERLNHRLEVVGGVCEKECVALLQNFFVEKRKALKKKSSYST
jgi:tRNA(adenine34) deaminase